MKICHNNPQRASATLTFTFLLAIMAILFAANSKFLIHLHREIKLLDQQQIKRLHSVSANPPAATNSISK